MRSVALLRGVNVGGKNKITMSELCAWLRAAGFTTATTYIQSGNLLLSHSRRTDVARVVHDVIAAHTRYDITVVTRTTDELADVVRANPFSALEPTQLHVSFLNAAPDDAALAVARSAEWAPEEFRLVGREVYLHLPRGMGRSIMVPRLALITPGTTRNWNTVLTLADLATG